ncbi:hypothetical protein BLAT2472_10806 [Burkholderia latens]
MHRRPASFNGRSNGAGTGDLLHAVAVGNAADGQRDAAFMRIQSAASVSKAACKRAHRLSEALASM